MSDRKPQLRCAVYTRKSSEEGLEQEFNSLHAQRESCEAYVLSQAGEGWTVVPTLYDDGGFSGGNTKRPALQRLLDDIDAQRIDIVVVYKVDRLTRSLNDFAKIVDRFDARGVSFVSVTQAFNTTSSMGRLTLNVLLSFAQFEREVTGERIRDKIALSKAKGVWMGGVVPLGYDLQDRRLIANPTEATAVRRIFQRYLDLQSVNLLREEVEREGIWSKAWTTSGGRQLGDRPLARGALFHILQNRIYVGEIVHKDKIHAALHSPIIDRPTFDAVQEQLRASRSGHAARKVRAAGAALIGRVFDSERRLMSPSCAYGKKGRLYRYYISLPLQVGERASGVDGVKRVSAEALERYLGDLVGRLAALPRITTDDLATYVRRVDLGAETTEVVLESNALFGGRNARFAFADIQARLGADEVVAWEDRRQTALRVRLPLCLRLRGGRTWIDGRQHAGESSQGNSGLVAALRAAHSGLQTANASPLTPPEEFASAQAPLTQHARQVSRLAFLAPDLQARILRGEEPRGLKLRTILKSELPLAWADQRALFATSPK